MNKQEAIKEMGKIDGLTIKDKSVGFYIKMIPEIEILKIINQLNEPKKPVVPQFIADWYEENKDDFEYSVQRLCVHGCEPVRKIDTWFDSDVNKPIETLVKMKLYGYEVEKERLYTVEIPNPNKIGNERNVLMKNGFNQITLLRVYDYDDNWRNNKAYQLTESEIKKDFEWAWQWAKEVVE